jgi:hypothetical protein
LESRGKRSRYGLYFDRNERGFMMFFKRRKAEKNAEINKVFLEGYLKGIEEGRRQIIQSKITPNMLREYLGLEPLKKK